MTIRSEKFTYSVVWNLLLITVGSVIIAAAMKGIVVHHAFIPGGVFGVGLLIYYAFPVISAGILYFILNIPLFVVSWVHVSRRFFLYSLYAMVLATVSYELITLDFGIHDQLYAAIAAGGLIGFGAGIVLRSLGSNGGLDVVAVLLNQKYNIGIGKTYFLFNFILFGASLMVLDIDLIIASLILVFITSVVLESTLGLFNQRKLVLIISDHSQEIADEMINRMKMGATFIRGHGAYSRKDKNIIMAITNNIVLKRLEHLVFSKDEHAIFVVENTFNVLGSSFSKRKIY